MLLGRGPHFHLIIFHSGETDDDMMWRFTRRISMMDVIGFFSPSKYEEGRKTRSPFHLSSLKSLIDYGFMLVCDLSMKADHFCCTSMPWFCNMCALYFPSLGSGETVFDLFFLELGFLSTLHFKARREKHNHAKIHTFHPSRPPRYSTFLIIEPSIPSPSRNNCIVDEIVQDRADDIGDKMCM